MKNLLTTLTLLTITLLLSSCDKEFIQLNGNYKNLANTDSYFVVKMKSRIHHKEQILDTIKVENGEFEFYTKAIKPPVKLTFVSPDNLEFDVWAGEYGTTLLEVKKDSIYDANVLGSFFCDELQKMNSTLNKMYLDPIKEKELEVVRLEELEKHSKLTEDEDVNLYEFQKDIKMAYRCRKKSILQTVRKNKQNPVALALMCQEYERLTSYQKKECYKYLSRSFGDTGLNWQMKN